MRVTGRKQIESIGINPCVVISADEAERLRSGWKRPLPVCFRVKPSEKVWQINLMPVGNETFYLYLHETIRRATGTKVGDTVDYEIWFDTAYKNGPQHELLPEFAAALAAHPPAKKKYDSLPPSMQKEITRYFSRLKSSAAIIRNVDLFVKALTGENIRWLGRKWNK